MKKVELETIISSRLYIYLLTIFFIGCAGKHDVRIEDLDVPVPDMWGVSIPQSEQITGDWWSYFNDLKFNTYLNNLRNESPDIKTLYQNQRMAYHSARINGASIYPAVNMSAKVDTSVQNLAGFGFADSFLNAGNGQDSTGNGQIFADEVITFGNKNYGLGLNLQWEIDIWGRLLNGRKAAYKDFEAAQYDLSYLGFSILVHGAQLYFQGRESAAQLALAQESYNSLVEIRDLVKERYEKGLRSSLDYRLAETSVATSIVTIENRKNQLKTINRQLEILIGQYPSGTLVERKVMPDNLPPVPAGIPAAVLGRRPDIRSLILKVESASHRAAQAKRNLLPGITLNGSAGTSTRQLEEILNRDHGIWTLGLNVTAPVFNGNRLRAAVKVQEASFERSKQELIRGILGAFSEIEQLLQSSESLNIQLDALETAVQQSEDAYTLSKERYDKGVTTLESVLNSQRQYNTIRSQHLTLRRQAIDNRLSLILVLGGDMNSYHTQILH